MSPRGLCDESEMLKYRKMVIELNNNLDSIPLRSDREMVRFLIRTSRRFTIAEVNRIANMHYNILARTKDGKEAVPVQRADNSKV